MVPKGLIDVAVTYSIKSEGPPTDQKISVAVANPPRAVVRLIGDTADQWILVGNTVSKNPFLDSNLRVAFTEVGTITSIGFDAVDKTTEVLQAVVGTLVQAAKTFVPMQTAEARVPECKGETSRRDSLKAELLKPRGTWTYSRLARIRGVREELRIVDELVSRCFEENRAVTTERQVTYYTTLDPNNVADFKPSGSDLLVAKVLPPPGFLAVASDVAVPQILVSLKLPPKAVGGRDIPRKTGSSVAGVVYRSPARVELAIEMGDSKVLSYRGDVLLPQFGMLQVGELTAKKLGSRSTMLNFSDATGGLREYSVGTTTNAKASAENLTASLANIQQGLLDIRYGLPTQQATLQKNLRDAQGALLPAPPNTIADSTTSLLKLKAFIDAQIELAKAQRVLDSLRTRNH